MKLGELRILIRGFFFAQVFRLPGVKTVTKNT